MITIFLGDDVAESRKRYHTYKQKMIDEGAEIAELPKDKLPELKTGLIDSISLFATRRVYFAENILSKKAEREMVSIFDTTNRDTELVVWEESIEDRVAKFFFSHAKIDVSKFSATIFTFLDSIYPSNKKNVLETFHTLLGTIDEHMIVVMLQRRIRELLLVAGGKQPLKLASWQVSKLKQQVNFWGKSDKLTEFYDGLYRIELYEKTGTNYYSIQQALDILFIYYL